MESGVMDLAKFLKNNTLTQSEFLQLGEAVVLVVLEAHAANFILMDLKVQRKFKYFINLINLSVLYSLPILSE